MDRTAFKKQSFEESDNTIQFWLDKTPAERFAASIYLQSIVYGFDLNSPPKLDKSKFSQRKHTF